jgi:small subunit ribosomal protein S23e
MGKCKPRGLQAARKLRTHRREQRWADKQYNKRALGTAYKSSPFGGASHAKGIVLDKMYIHFQPFPDEMRRKNLIGQISGKNNSGIESKQPNSAIRKCVRAQLIKNAKKVTAFVPNDGCLNFVDENVRTLYLYWVKLLVLCWIFGERGLYFADVAG